MDRKAGDKWKKNGEIDFTETRMKKLFWMRTKKNMANKLKKNGTLYMMTSWC